MSRNYTLYGALCGVLAPTVFLILYIISWSLSPWYVFGCNYFSDLGVGEGAWAYNSGVIIAGFLGIPFALSIWNTLKPGLLQLFGSVVFAATGIALVSVGVFTEDYGDLHLAVSILFFSLALMSVTLLAWPLIRSSRTQKAGLVANATVVVAVIAVAVAGFNPSGETIAIIEILIWTFIVAFQILLVEKRRGNES